MHDVDFGSPAGSQQHECEAYDDGDWIVFRCPICKDYERRINKLTGKMRVSNANAHIRHAGFNRPNPQIEKWNGISTVSGDPIWKLN